MSHIHQLLQHQHTTTLTVLTASRNQRPWSELTDRTAFTKPESLTDATSRIRRNYSYFRVNYLSLIAIVLTVSLITHPFSLFTLAAVIAAWCRKGPRKEGDMVWVDVVDVAGGAKWKLRAKLSEL